MKIYKNKIGLLIVICLAGFKGNSQCITDEMYLHYKDHYPQHFISPQQLTPAQTVSKRATKYIIPVVFHIVHTNGRENISKEQILEQMQILNEDFSFTNPNKGNIRSQFIGRAVDCEIEFRLAKLDPNGNCTDGIHRVYNETHRDVRDEVKTAVPSWDYRKYLNIWVVSSIRSQTGEGTTLGYATLPYNTNATTDGIVVRADAVGDTVGIASRQGTTVTHEIGHYLGLLHPFQGGCDDDDLFLAQSTLKLCNDDTPPVLSTFTNANCPSNGNSCSTDSPDELDMWENYMDYSEGDCQAMFTSCQKKLMHYFLESNQAPRKSLWSESNLIATGINPPLAVTEAPEAQFFSSTKVACVGEPVQFFDESCKQQVESRQWTLSGASISQTNAENPVVTYSQPGYYTVKLKVSNSSGSNEATKTDFIRIRPSSSDQHFLRQEFESDDYIHQGYVFGNAAGVGFERTTDVSYNGTGCLRLPIDENSTFGSTYFVDLPPVNLSNYTTVTPKLTFMVGYRRASTTEFEVMRIYVSTDCGKTFTQRKVLTGAALSTSGLVETNYVPQSQNDWKRVSYSLFDYKGESNVIIRLEVESASGNSVHIDDINISQFNTSLNEIAGNNNFVTVSPNPNKGKTLKVKLISKTKEEATITILDMTGKEMGILYSGSIDKGENDILLNPQFDLSNGVYFLKTTVGNKSNFTKISIIK